MRRLITDFRGGDLSGRCRYPLRLEKVPQISQIYTDFYWDVFLVTQISQMTQIFFSSDDTEFIRRFPAETITHGFSRRRPIRSVQIPTESGQRDSTEIPLKICVYLWNLWDKIILTKKNLCISVKSVGRNNPHKEKSASSAKSAWQKTTGAYIGREPLASGQSSAKFRE